MDIYFLLELAFVIAFSFVFLLAGLNAEEWWHGLIFFFLGMLASVESALLLLATGEAFSYAFSMFFAFIGIIDFVLVVLVSFQAWGAVHPSRNRRYRPEED